MFQYRVVISSAMGLGLGVSLTWLVYSQPVNITARPEAAIPQPFVQFTSVRFNSEAEWVPILNSSLPLKLPLSASKTVQELGLGHQVELLGANNGIYQYRIVEIRYAPTAEVSQLTTELSGTLLITVPASLLHTQQIVLVLR